MIRSLAYKVEGFNQYCKRCHSMTNAVNEVCFDIQLQFVSFFTASIKLIHGAGELDFPHKYVTTTSAEQLIHSRFDEWRPHGARTHSEAI